MILKLHPLPLTSSNVTTCPEPPALPSTNAACPSSRPAGTARVGALLQLWLCQTLLCFTMEHAGF